MNGIFSIAFRNMHPPVLCYIPARGGSKRIPGKNIRPFCGRPLLAYTAEQAKALPWVDRIVLDTDDSQIADVGRAAGLEVPFLRPAEFATDDAQVIESVLHMLDRLERHDGYRPTYLLLLQTTSPLREVADIQACWDLLQATDATTVLTVCPTHPRLYHRDADARIRLVNGNESHSTNMQAWPPAFLLNGCFAYLVRVDALRAEHRIITNDTRAVVCPKWRSVDLDTPEEWVLAEHLYRHKEEISRAMAAEGAR